MRIGELAERVGVPTRTIRFYERRGLLAEPRRSANGYREYGPSAVGRLKFIRSAQAAGLTLEEIRGVVEIRDTGEAPCLHLEGLLNAKLAQVRRRQVELVEMERELEGLLERSRNLDPADCGPGHICHIIEVETAI